MQTIILKTIDSTQNFAKSAIEKNSIVAPTLIVAEEQTAGYGQYSRKWAGEKGNLYMTLALPFPECIPELTLVIAAAMLLALPPGITIKPVNDLYYRNGKIAGILCEYYHNILLIGIGVNIAHAPHIAEQKTSCLADMLYHTTPIELAHILTKEIIHMLSQYQTFGMQVATHIIENNIYQIS